jgi:hypothetical protein
MLPSFWRAKSEPGKDAGSVRIDFRYGRTEDAAWRRFAAAQKPVGICWRGT